MYAKKYDAVTTRKKSHLGENATGELGQDDVLLNCLNESHIGRIIEVNSTFDLELVRCSR